MTQISENRVFRSFFSKKKAALTGAPAIRRMKTYSAQSGYVYQYFYEGQREFRAGAEHGAEFVFQISADRKNWRETSVFVGDAALATWQEGNGRELTSTERYAVAKIALFQAFDERPTPAAMNSEIHVRAADVQGIIESLDL
jgi:hypothetical protein